MPSKFANRTLCCSIGLDGEQKLFQSMWFYNVLITGHPDTTVIQILVLLCSQGPHCLNKFSFAGLSYANGSLVFWFLAFSMEMLLTFGATQQKGHVMVTICSPSSRLATLNWVAFICLLCGSFQMMYANSSKV